MFSFPPGCLLFFRFSIKNNFTCKNTAFFFASEIVCFCLFFVVFFVFPPAQPLPPVAAGGGGEPMSWIPHAPGEHAGFNSWGCAPPQRARGERGRSWTDEKHKKNKTKQKQKRQYRKQKTLCFKCIFLSENRKTQKYNPKLPEHCENTGCPSPQVVFLGAFCFHSHLKHSVFCIPYCFFLCVFRRPGPSSRRNPIVHHQNTIEFNCMLVVHVEIATRVTFVQNHFLFGGFRIESFCNPPRGPSQIGWVFSLSGGGENSPYLTWLSCDCNKLFEPSGFTYASSYKLCIHVRAGMHA